MSAAGAAEVPGPGVSTLGPVPSVARTATVVIDRTWETELLQAALASGAHAVLEGPPGTGKSTLLRAVAAARSAAFVLVEGNAELTPARLVGHFDPALVLARGYQPEVFVDGPLLDAMREGGLLYVEELNRVPEETLNVLLTVMSERELNVPRLGRVAADPEFRIVAAMNPFDAVGTARISAAVYDRMCRITMGYQSHDAESEITRQQTPAVPDDWRRRVVELVRSTRAHAEIRAGASVRGAIDLIGIAAELSAARGVAVTDWRVGLDAALVALSGRIRLEQSAARTPEEIIRTLYVVVFGAEADAGEAGGEDPGKA